MHSDFSVVTIVKSRIRQLTNLIRSIEQSNELPNEVIVVWMAPPCSESLITSKYFSIQHKFVANDLLPIPKARNKGFQSAKNECVIYLDVDCICGPDSLGRMASASKPGRVVTTQIGYLEILPEHVDYDALLSQTISSPNATQQALEQDICMDAFHTTSFSLLKDDFENVEGFDETYCGFGVGDVDFATRCQAEGISLYILPDEILRQFHPRVDPPINHLSDIVNNAAIFKRKWGTYPVKQWLTQFAEEGLINNDFTETGLRVRRLPTQEEIHSHMTSRPY